MDTCPICGKEEWTTHGMPNTHFACVREVREGAMLMKARYQEAEVTLTEVAATLGHPDDSALRLARVRMRELEEQDIKLETLPRALKRLGALVEKIEQLNDELDQWHESCHKMERERDEAQELLRMAISDLAPYLNAENYTKTLRRRITK